MLQSCGGGVGMVGVGEGGINTGDFTTDDNLDTIGYTPWSYNTRHQYHGDIHRKDKTVGQSRTSIMRVPLLVKQNLYTKTSPRFYCWLFAMVQLELECPVLIYMHNAPAVVIEVPG